MIDYDGLLPCAVLLAVSSLFFVLPGSCLHEPAKFVRHLFNFLEDAKFGENGSELKPALSSFLGSKNENLQTGCFLWG